ncbi:hypothetical protein JTB14_028389 [Gonioctena quinquepunctata]|nr:hypothetical protein JTB14_028389 [Gonioctena quinquepunctata]
MWKSVLILTLCGLSLVECGLTLGGVECGVKTCRSHEYCSDFDKTCAPCSGICNDSDHNFDKISCEKNCQDYLHDTLYVKKDSGGNGNGDLRSTVERLSRMIIGTLIVVCLMLIVLFSFLSFQLYRWKAKKNITLASLKNKIIGKKVTTMSPEENTPGKTHGNLTSENNKKNDLRLEMPAVNSRGSEHSPVTVTTSISRRPAEDNKIDSGNRSKKCSVSCLLSPQQWNILILVFIFFHNSRQIN